MSKGGSDARLEGGQRALLGFYYQFMALLAMGGSLISHRVANPIDTDHEETRLLLTTFKAESDGNIHLESEEYGQDIVFANGRNYRLLIQAKFSKKPGDNVLTLSDLREILYGFISSMDEVESTQPSDCAFIVLTNRPINPDVRRVLKIAAKCREIMGRTSVCLNGLPANATAYQNQILDETSGLSLTATVTKWLTSGTDRKTKQPANNVQKVSKLRRETKKPTDKEIISALRLLPGLYMASDIGMWQFQERFEHLAHEYGTKKEDEITLARRALLGGLLEPDGKGSVKLDKCTFAAAIAGRRDALKLTPDELRNPCAHAMTEWIKSEGHHVDWIIRRPQLERNLWQKLQETQTRVVFLFGEGGCGKSVVLSSLLKDVIEGEPFSGFVILSNLSNWGQFGLEWHNQIIGAWAKRLNGGKTFDQAISRLEIANETASNGAIPGVLLWIGLDGSDERLVGEESVFLSDLVPQVIKLVRASSHLRLIVTCRGRHGEESSAISRYVYPRNQYPPKYPLADRDVDFYEVTNFGDDELLNIADEKFSQEAREMMYSSLGYGGRNAALPPPVSGARDPFIESLRHPRMMGAFMAGTADIQGLDVSSLRGDKTAQFAIARYYLKAFLIKYESRRKPGLPAAGIFADGLQNIARRSRKTRASTYTHTDWENWIREITGLSLSEARDLFQEAAPGGLIQDLGQRRWNWKHGFVAQYLSTVENVRECCP